MIRANDDDDDDDCDDVDDECFEAWENLNWAPPIVEYLCSFEAWPNLTLTRFFLSYWRVGFARKSWTQQTSTTELLPLSRLSCQATLKSDAVFFPSSIHTPCFLDDRLSTWPCEGDSRTNYSLCRIPFELNHSWLSETATRFRWLFAEIWPSEWATQLNFECYTESS